MKLVVVESPTKARTLAKFLPKEYQIESSMGHVRDLPKSGLGIDTEHDFRLEYAILEDKEKQVALLKSAAEKAKEIYLATDPDREGEAIAYHVAYILGKRDYKRVTFHEITKEAILHAIVNPGKIDQKLVDAQQARRVLDRLVGYKLSPVLWKKVRRGLSAGRVQSVAVRLIVEREREIEAFRPDEYWEIFVRLEAKTGEFVAQVVKEGGEAIEIADGKKAERVVADLKTHEFVVSAVSEKKYHSAPPPPFTTSTLQQTAARCMGWTSKKTMSTAQQLYERGYITYHRTDSLNLAKSAVAEARDFIGKTYGKEYLPEKDRFYKTKSKSAQEAHEAIRPTDVKRQGDGVNGERIMSSHVKLYELIRTRFLQTQMSDAIYDKTDIVVTAGKYQLSAKGNRLVFDGWTRIGKAQEDMLVPQVAAEERLLQKGIDPQQKFTQPPPRYSEASLIKELEKRGIGRPSTYASIITTIQDRMYVEKKEKRFVPTVVGAAVTDFLTKNFGGVMEYEFTAKMEDQLDEIAEGKHKWVAVVGDFWKPFEKLVVEVEKNGKRVEIPVEKTGEKCPKCKTGEVVIRTGRFGKFKSCSRFPECDYTEQYFVYVEGVACPDDDGRIVERSTRFGKIFYGCENYPKCKWASWNRPKQGETLLKSSEKPKKNKRGKRKIKN